MATPLAHDTNRSGRPGTPVWPRVLGYARPYVALILLALTLTLVFGVGRFALAYLMKPIVDDVILPHGALVTAPGAPAWLPDLAWLPGAGETRQADPRSTPPAARDLDESEIDVVNKALDPIRSEIAAGEKLSDMAELA